MADPAKGRSTFEPCLKLINTTCSEKVWQTVTLIEFPGVFPGARPVPNTVRKNTQN